jgi:hypothetical protein
MNTACAEGLVRIGEITSGLEILKKNNEGEVKIELYEKQQK